MKKKLARTLTARRALQLLALASAFLFSQVAVSAQNSGAAISGRILDSQRAAVAGATVTIYERSTPQLRLTTVSDASGAYRFANLAAGEYLFEVEAQGLALKSETRNQIVKIERGETKNFDIALEPQGVAAEVVVTAADAPQSTDEVSKSVNVIMSRELEARNEITIPDALRTVPGLRVQQLGGTGTLTSIKTRGLRNQDTAVLIDGLRLRDAASPQGDATAFLSDLIVVDASRVEIVRGSGSSLYGTNAIGGVVNIITDEGGGRFRGSLLAEGGGLGEFRGRANFAGGFGDDHLIYSAGLAHLNVTRGIDGDDRARNTSGQGRLLFRLSPTMTLTGRIHATDAFVQTNVSPQVVGKVSSSGIIDAVPLALSELRRYEQGTPISSLNIGNATFIPSANDPDASQSDRFFSGALTFNYRPSERFGFNATYQLLDTNRISRNGPGGIGFQPSVSNRSDYDGRINTLNARADFILGSCNFITAGYEFESENFFNLTTTNVLTTGGVSSVDVTERSHSVFAQDQLHLLDERLQLAASFRAQFFDLRAPQFDPAGSIPYAGKFSSPPNAYTGDGSFAYIFRSTNTKLRGHVGNGYRAPSLYERFGTFFFGGSFSALGDPRLAPERSIAFDAGADQTFARERVRASATYFYTRLQRVIAFDNVLQPDPFGRFFGGYLNASGGLARGAELSATFAPTRATEIFTSYTYTNSRQRQPVLGELRSLVIPNHQFTFVFTQRVRSRLLLNFTLAAQSSYLAPIFDNNTFASRVYRFAPYARANLSGSYALPLAENRTLRFFVTIQNLFDAQIYESGFRTPGVTARAGAAFSW